MLGASRSIIAAAAVALATASAASAQPLVTAGAKNTQAVFACVDFDAATDLASYTLTVPYGRRGRILLVNAFTRGMPTPYACDQSLVLTVGPASPESFGGSVTGRQGGSYTATGHWWADIDANEAASPGDYVGVPIPIQLDVHRHAGDLCQFTCFTLDVQMVKK